MRLRDSHWKIDLRLITSHTLESSVDGTVSSMTFKIQQSIPKKNDKIFTRTQHKLGSSCPG